MKIRITNHPRTPVAKPFYIDDELVQIRRHKGTRGRIELYVHHPILRQWLKNVEVYIPGEAGSEAKRLAKRILFREIEYGIMVQKFCWYFYRNMDDIEAISEVLSKAEEELAHLTEGYDDEAPWDEAYREIQTQLEDVAGQR